MIHQFGKDVVKAFVLAYTNTPLERHDRRQKTWVYMGVYNPTVLPYTKYILL